MTPRDLLTFLQGHKLGVVATVAETGAPQAAVVGIAVSDQLEIVFDTLRSTRKYQNIVHRPRAALVVGWDDECTAQLDCNVDEPSGAELERLKSIYFAAYPDGPERLSWPGITYLRLCPTWARFSDFRAGSSTVVEFSERLLSAL